MNPDPVRFAALFTTIFAAAMIAGLAGFLIHTPTAIPSPPSLVVVSSDGTASQGIDLGSCAFRSGTKGC